MVDIEKEKTKGEEVHEEIQRIRYETVYSTDQHLLHCAGICFDEKRMAGH